MSDRLEFREKLGGILQKAQGAQNVLSVREVEEYFAEDGLSREQMELVCDYLLSQKVAVKGYVKQGGTVTEKTEEQAEEHYTEEEKRYLARYMEEIKTIKAEEAGERQKLFAASIEGDALARGRLIELYLEKVVEVAKEMYHKEVFLGDLIQEGNVSLMLALDELKSAEEAHGKIMEEVRAGMQMLIEEQTEVKRRDHTLLEKYTDLDDNIKKLKEETGRDVTIEEVSAFLDMSEEEINDILNLGEQ